MEIFLDNLWIIYGYSVGNVIIPIDELIFFRGIDTTNQINNGNQCTVGITMSFAPSPSHHQFDSWYGYHSDMGG